MFSYQQKKCTSLRDKNVTNVNIDISTCGMDAVMVGDGRWSRTAVAAGYTM